MDFIGEASADGGAGRTGIDIDEGLAGPVSLAQERRDGDRGEDTYNDDHQKLNEREAALAGFVLLLHFL